MKHGIAMEPAAKREYITTQKKTHRKFKAINTGLAVNKDKSFLAASSDMETFCMCCGSGLCEIKCPEIIKDQTPTPTNVPFIFEQDDTLSVDPNHSYYYQIQGQMAICQKAFCDFFVFTFHGHLLLRVFFDAEFWENVKDKLCWFWLEHILPSLYEMDDNNNVSTKPVRRMLMPVANVDIEKTSLHSEKVKKKGKSTMPRKIVFHCGVCRKECLDFPGRSQDQSVCCDECETWVHYDCAGVTEDTVESIDVWICDKCLK
ncbi:uncharacterized protein LOC127869228 [Dreissena polymorpha]|uniref:uncharacterized protein LOC127869228 n=1 Tax=Dreissena polymorpha TaxID=45954 RepID=UPI002264A250|nr:uncharacterized protein LOC127869228 [Dreissena polymorpha]